MQNSSFCRDTAAVPETLRILTYNVRNGQGLDAPEIMDVARIGRIIAAQQPDVVALQELDRKTRRSAGRDILQELAEATGMTGTYGQAIVFQDGGYGIGVLSRTPPLRAYQRALPCPQEARTLLVCEFGTFVLFCTHLSLNPGSRMAAVEIINAELEAFTKPVFLAGDFNAAPDAGDLRALQGAWRRISPLEPTFPADRPEIMIDHIFAAHDAQIEVIETRVIDEPAASDHRPVLAVVRLVAG